MKRIIRQSKLLGESGRIYQSFLLTDEKNLVEVGTTQTPKGELHITVVIHDPRVRFKVGDNFSSLQEALHHYASQEIKDLLSLLPSDLEKQPKAYPSYQDPRRFESAVEVLGNTPSERMTKANEFIQEKLSTGAEYGVLFHDAEETWVALNTDHPKPLERGEGAK